MKIIFFIATLLISACSFNQQSYVDSSGDEEFLIYDSNSNKHINYELFLNELVKADIVLIGEIHTEKSHHKIEKKLLVDLSNLKKISVVLEMGDISQQGIWNQVKLNTAKIKPNQLSKAINWNEKWDYSLYKDIVEPIFYSDMTPIAGNLSKEEIDTIYKGAQPIYGTISNTAKVKSMIKDRLVAQHSISDNALVDKMVQIQQYKDRRMADKLVNQNKLAVLIAGRLHVNKLMGVPLHIEEFNKNKIYKVVVLGHVSDSKEEKQKIFTDFYIETKNSK